MTGRGFRSGRGFRYGRGALGGVAVIAAAVGGLHYFQAAARPSMSPSITGMIDASCSRLATVTSCGRPAGERPGAATASSARYQDGSYTAQGSYLTPGGDESIGVRLSVAADRIVSAQVEVKATSPTARQFQSQFVTRYADQVVSRDLASVDVSRLAGASLTSLGFDNALTQIRSAARVRA